MIILTFICSQLMSSNYLFSYVVNYLGETSFNKMLTIFIKLKKEKDMSSCVSLATNISMTVFTQLG